MTRTTHLTATLMNCADRICMFTAPMSAPRARKRASFLLVIALTGFATELLHYARAEPLRYAAYVAHLVSIFGLLWLLPYSKLAHVVYRTLALVYAERTGRGGQ